MLFSLCFPFMVLSELELKSCSIGETFKNCFSICFQTLCRLCVSRNGLKEDDLTDMLNMASHIWSPLYFALEQYITVKNGLIG